MANPTTNYGWPMPTSTDLVTDLPADFAAFGQPVDTSLKALNPETTLGDIAYRSATSNTNTRLGIGTNGQVLAVSGGVPAWTTTADVTPLTTKGDLFTFDTADARLGVGTNGQTLVADSTASTGLKWETLASGGGMTSIASGSLSGTSVVLGSISSAYKQLQLIIKSATWGTGNSYLTLQVNSITANYDFTAALAAATFGGFVYASNNQSVWRFASDASQTNNNDQNMYVVNIYDYASTNDTKLGSVDFRMDTGVSRVYGGALAVAGVDAAISSLTISTNAGYTFNGGTYILYGVS